MAKIHPALMSDKFIQRNLQDGYSKRSDGISNEYYDNFTKICAFCGCDNYAHQNFQCPEDLDRDGNIVRNTGLQPRLRQTEFKLSQELTTAYRAYLRIKGIKNLWGKN